MSAPMSWWPVYWSILQSSTNLKAYPWLFLFPEVVEKTIPVCRWGRCCSQVPQAAWISPVRLFTYFYNHDFQKLECIPEWPRHLRCQELLQGLRFLIPAALAYVSHVSFGFPYWSSHYNYCPVAVSALDWCRRFPVNYRTLIFQLSPLKITCF